MLRGKWVLDNLLNAPPPEPPADVPNLDEATIGTSASMRAQLEEHRKNAICASCHRRMDPLGFGLENFDAVGAWRDHGGQVPDRRIGPAAGRPPFHRPRRAAEDPLVQTGTRLPARSRRSSSPTGSDAVWSGTIRGPSSSSPAGCRSTTTGSRGSCSRSSTACRSSRGDPRRRRHPPRTLMHRPRPSPEADGRIK